MTMKEKLFDVLDDQKLIERIEMHLGKEISIWTAYYDNDRLFAYIDATSDSYGFVINVDDEVQIILVDLIHSLSEIRKHLAIAGMIQSHLTMNKDWRK